MWSSLLLLTFVAQSVFAAGGNCSFWLEDIKHQGFAAYNVNASSFKVFRNVKDYGAVGDGMADDTAAINMAISSGPTCATGSCLTSSVSCLDGPSRPRRVGMRMNSAEDT